MNYYNTILKMYFRFLNLPIKVFGKTSNNSEDKFDRSIFVQKTYLRTYFIESNIEEDIDLKNQNRIKNS